MTLELSVSLLTLAVLCWAMAKLDGLRAQIAQLKTVETSAVALLVGLKEKLDAAIAADDDGQALDELSAELGATTADLAAAVSANTPAQPPTPAAGAATSNTAPTPTDQLPPDHPLAQPKPADTQS